MTVETDVAIVQTTVNALKEEFKEHLRECKEFNKLVVAQLEEVKTALASARGGWKTLVMVGAIAGSIMTVVGNWVFLAWLKTH